MIQMELHPFSARDIPGKTAPSPFPPLRAMPGEIPCYEHKGIVSQAACSKSIAGRQAVSLPGSGGFGVVGAARFESAFKLRMSGPLHLPRNESLSLEAIMGSRIVRFKCLHSNHCCRDVVCLPTPYDVLRIALNTGADPRRFLEF